MGTALFIVFALFFTMYVILQVSSGALSDVQYVFRGYFHFHMHASRLLMIELPAHVDTTSWGTCRLSKQRTHGALT